MIDSITSFPSPFITAIAIASLCTSMPIYLMSIRVLLSVELCVTLKTYLKGAPFYNASCWRKCGVMERCLHFDLPEAGFWIPAVPDDAWQLKPVAVTALRELVLQ
jgi:hypothetical protein